MKIAIIGASGFVGAPVTAEALARGHEVTAIVRDISKLPPHPRLHAFAANATDAETLAEALGGHDVAIHAFHPGKSVPMTEIYDLFVEGHKAIIAAAKNSGVPRLLCVGGAASLKTEEGLEYLDSKMWNPEFEPFRPAIMGTRALYYLLKDETELDWVFLAPSVMLRPGERTGAYRTGEDHVLFDAEGQSRISLEDYAVAMLDEAETPRHHRERFTVGY
jgi:putative NADH-flavin reductase